MPYNSDLVIKCKTTIGKEERIVAAEIMMSLKREKTICVIGTIVFLCLAAIFLFLGFCTFLSEGMTPIAFSYFKSGAFELFMAIVFKRIIKTIGLIKIKMREKATDKVARNDYPDFDKREYAFSENGIVSTSYLGEFQWNWDAVKTYGSIRHYIYLILVNRNLILADSNTISSEEKAMLLDLIKQKMGDSV